MNKIEYIAPCHFGLEAVLKREIRDLGLEVISVDDGRVTFAGDESTAAASIVMALGTAFERRSVS